LAKCESIPILTSSTSRKKESKTGHKSSSTCSTVKISARACNEYANVRRTFH
jgi:hypothetical protein